MKPYKRIIPNRERCDCGKKVKNHHWFCDKCWGEKMKSSNHHNRKQFIKSLKAEKMKKYGKIPLWLRNLK